MVYVAAQPVSGAGVAAADGLAEARWFGLAGGGSADARHCEPAREYLRRML